MSVCPVTALAVRKGGVKTNIPNDQSSLVPMTIPLLIRPPRYTLTSTLFKTSVPQENLVLSQFSEPCKDEIDSAHHMSLQ